MTVITNGIRAISALAEYDNVAVYGISGKLRHHSLSMVGSQAESFVRDFWASKLFFSCTGLSMSHGAMDYSDAEAEVRKTMMNVCQKKSFWLTIRSWSALRFTVFAAFQISIPSSPIKNQTRNGNSFLCRTILS